MKLRLSRCFCLCLNLRVWIILVISARPLWIAENILLSLSFCFFNLFSHSGSVSTSSSVQPHKPSRWQKLVVSCGMGWKSAALAQPWEKLCGTTSWYLSNGYPPVISYGGVLLLGLPVLFQEPCPQLVAFQCVLTAPNLALTVWAVSYWGQWESSS